MFEITFSQLQKIKAWSESLIMKEAVVKIKFACVL